MIPLEQISSAYARIHGHVRRTPLMSASRLGDAAGVSLSLKCESFQRTGSFKVRGALNAVLQLDADQRAQGVITVSAGNHAQALAFAAGVGRVNATVVMPAKASAQKVAASRGYGANVVLHGTTAIEAFAYAHELERERGLLFIHPFDNPLVIAGAGTVGFELIEADKAEPDVVVVSIGGGGLISGVASALRALRPSTRIVGVEPVGAAAMRRSLDAGHPIRLKTIDTIADGLSAPMAGDLTYPIVRDLVDDVVLVTDEEIGAAMRDLLSSAKLVAEPAAAAALAAVTTDRIGARPGSRVVAVISGGNVDLTRLAEIAAR